MSSYDLNLIKSSVEKMDIVNQTEIGKIIYKHKPSLLNGNQNGVYINLTELPEEILNDIIFHINYVQKQEVNLMNIERQVQEYKDTYFEDEEED